MFEYIFDRPWYLHRLEVSWVVPLSDEDEGLATRPMAGPDAWPLSVRVDCCLSLSSTAGVGEAARLGGRGEFAGSFAGPSPLLVTGVGGVGGVPNTSSPSSREAGRTGPCRLARVTPDGSHHLALCRTCVYVCVCVIILHNVRTQIPSSPLLEQLGSTSHQGFVPR